MGILNTLLSMLGLADTSSDDDDPRDPTVSVERETRTGSEAAVKGTDMEAADDEGVAADTDASASTETLVDDEGAAEPAEAAGPDDGVTTELDTAESESQGETTGEHEADDDADAEVDDAAAESTDVIKGIGPAYAERLSEAGVDSVADLAAADAETLADAIELSPKRVGRWIDRAKDR
jgi:predicted flap endonuclease-1-like 5' DNA nuclease